MSERSTAPSTLTLPERAIHVWRLGLDVSEREAGALVSLLVPEEQARAAQYVRQEDRRSFVASRAALRKLAGAYLGIDPNRLEFGQGPWGKPGLAGAEGQWLQFNVAHSRGVGLLAFAARRMVGVDVEAIRPMDDAAAIVARFFSPRERAMFDELADAEKMPAFFRAWTRKEAYIKAIGRGLSQPLEQFDVSLAPGEPARLLSVAGQPEEAGRWSLVDLDVGAGYAAALAAEGKGWELRCFEGAGLI